MYHIHDHAVGNGHLLTPCHVDFKWKDSYIVTNDVIVLMAFGQGITSSLSSVTSSNVFFIVLTPTCQTSMAPMAPLLQFWFLPPCALAEHPVLWSMGTIWSLDRLILSLWPCGFFPTALLWGWSGCSHFNLPVIKKRLQQLAWALKSIITPRISRQTQKLANS